MKLFQIPEDFAALSDDELRSFIAESSETVTKVAANPDEFVSDEFSRSDLMGEITDGVAAIEAAKNELASRAEAAAESEETSEEESEETAEEETDEAAAEALAALAGRATAAAEEAAAIEVEEAAAEVEETPAETPAEAVTASAAKGKTNRIALKRSRRSTPVVEETPRVSLVAAAENLGFGLGATLGETAGEQEMALARMMTKRRYDFGHIAEGTHGEKVPIARADWSGLYEEDRRLGMDVASNLAKVEAVTASGEIRRAFEERLKDIDSLVASGGLCAPRTPYYGLQMISQADRPVRAALASFNADRGGIQKAAPASLASVTTAVGLITEEEDAAGGSPAVKSCQRIDCPSFTTVDVNAIYHCLEFGNLGARAFPELVAQWTGLVMAAHAREAETALIDGIASASTAVTASNAAALGASAQLPSQIITAANGMRSRHRMAPDAVLRVLLPWWVLDLLVSDVYRSQFQRFDMTPPQFVALLRSHNVEPSFYLDGPTGGNQVWGAQAGGALDAFPSTVHWYLFPEGSFLYLDGGTLELGLVRDSVLNSTNDFQIFGETWENVAFVGVESLAVTSTVCDSGTVALPNDVSSCVSYA